MPQVIEIPDETQNLIGDLEYLTELSGQFFLKARPLIRQIKRHTNWAHAAERPAREAADLIQDWLIDGIITALEPEAKVARNEGGFDLAGALRKAARSAANQ